MYTVFAFSARSLSTLNLFLPLVFQSFNLLIFLDNHHAQECVQASWLGIIGSVINLASITVERYLKVVRPIWSKNKLRNWMVYSAMAYAWISSLVYNLTLAMLTSDTNSRLNID